MSTCSRPLVLLVEDEPKTSALIATYLEKDGFPTVSAADGLAALELFRGRQPGFVILDVMLPRLDGWEVCRDIRKSSDVPILFLSARDDETDRLLGLGLGADDYVRKPFSPREVVARVKGILRRAGQSALPATRGKRLGCGPLRVDLDLRRVTRAGEPVPVTAMEYALLSTLMSSPGRVFLRHELIARLYPRGEYVIDRVIDVHVGKLRQKIEKDSANPELIITVRGLGYRFTDEVTVTP